jgi:hypothetical protein
MRTLILSAAVAAALVAAAPANAKDPAYVDDRSTPEALMQSFYNAVTRHEYARAWSYYADGQGVAPFPQFVRGYADTASVTVKFGEAAQEGAAGSTYWTLPVRLDAVSTRGKHAYFVGCYTIRLAQPLNQAAPPYQPMHIVDGQLRKAPPVAKNLAPPDCAPGGGPGAGPGGGLGGPMPRPGQGPGPGGISY